MGEAEDIIAARERDQHNDRGVQIARLRQEHLQTVADIYSEIPLALGRLAERGYPGGEMMPVSEEVKTFWSGTRMREIGRFAVWDIGGRVNNRRNDERAPWWYLTSAGAIAGGINPCHIISRARMENGILPDYLLPNLQSLGTDDYRAY